MVDSWIGFDEDASVDKRMDMDARTVGGQTVYVNKIILVDGVTNNKANVNSDGALLVRLGTSITDVTSRGDSGSAPSAVSVVATGTGSPLLSAAANRRAVWFSNMGAAVVWVSPTETHPGVGRGIPLNPGDRICFDKSPNAPWSAKSVTGTNDVAILTEDD